MIRFIIVTVLLSSFALSGCSQASGIDDVLNNAKKEGRMVMLELGSVGCIPCERMKPVMEKLRTNYKGKLEVIFVAGSGLASWYLGWFCDIVTAIWHGNQDCII